MRVNDRLIPTTIVEALDRSGAREWVREEYLTALPILEIMSRPEPYRLIDAQRVRELEAEVEMLRSRARALKP